MKGATPLPVASTPAIRGVNPDADGNTCATKSASPPPASTATDAVGAPSTPSFHHLVTKPPSPPAKSPSSASLPLMNPPTPSISETQPPPAPSTESTVGDPSTASPLPRSTSVPASSSARCPAPPSIRDQLAKRSVASPLPQPQQPASPSLPTPTSPPVMQAAGTNSGGPDAPSSALAKAAFSDDEDLSDPPSNETNSDQDTAIHHHRVEKRLRADSSPAAKAPPKRRRGVKSAAKPKAVTANRGIRPPRPAQSSIKTKERRSHDDMDISLDDGPESEEGEGSNDEEVMGGQGNEFRGSKKAANPLHGRFVAGNQIPSLHAPSATVRLGNDFPATYEPLGDPLEGDELFELDWFAPMRSTAPQGNSSKGKTKSNAPVSGLSPPVSQMPPTRHWRSFAAPRMTLNPELEALGEVELSDGAFCFPFNAQVINALAH